MTNWMKINKAGKAFVMLAASLAIASSLWAEAKKKAPTTRPANDGPGAAKSAKAPTTRPAARPTTQPCPTTAPCPTAEPCPTTMPTTRPAPGAIKRFAANSPFGHDYKPPAEVNGKRIWARSVLWEKAPKLEVEKWLSADPNTTGKFVLIEFWATWCPPCRKSISLLNKLHHKFGKDLVVIGISDETEADVRKLAKTHPIEYFSAIDTKARMKEALGVWGIPHVILIEPGGHVVWEGFPLLPGHELTEKLVGRIIEIGRKAGSLK